MEVRKFLSFPLSRFLSFETQKVRHSPSAGCISVAIATLENLSKWTKPNNNNETKHKYVCAKKREERSSRQNKEKKWKLQNMYTYLHHRFILHICVHSRSKNRVSHVEECCRACDSFFFFILISFRFFFVIPFSFCHIIRIYAHFRSLSLHLFLSFSLSHTHILCFGFSTVLLRDFFLFLFSFFSAFPILSSAYRIYLISKFVNFSLTLKLRIRSALSFVDIVRWIHCWRIHTHKVKLFYYM